MMSDDLVEERLRKSLLRDHVTREAIENGKVGQKMRHHEADHVDGVPFYVFRAGNLGGRGKRSKGRKSKGRKRRRKNRK